VDRVVKFAATHRVRALLGAHIEMTQKPARDYGHEAKAHPDEHGLEMSVAQLRALQAGFRARLDVPDERQVHDDFIIVPVPPRDQSGTGAGAAAIPRPARYRPAPVPAQASPPSTAQCSAPQDRHRPSARPAAAAALPGFAMSVPCASYVSVKARGRDHRAQGHIMRLGGQPVHLLTIPCQTQRRHIGIGA
ncbi:hypothetical protein E4T56_gene27, partial [Termitomyces sp. T112]